MLDNIYYSFLFFTLFSTIAGFDYEFDDVPDINDTISLLLMGDPQYHFMCEEDNVQCKHVSRRCRTQYSLSISFEFVKGENDQNETFRQGKELCIRIESRFANRVQRQAIDQLIDEMENKPEALIINGDLTDFGHLHQLSEFKKGWYNNFKIPLLLGLGNHDYQNNINDCTFNFCAHTMLSWYAEYVKNRSLATDIRRVPKGLDVVYSGSLAYSERICGTNSKLCVFVIQLNNAVDYEVQFTSLFVEWNLSSPLKFLNKELDILEDIDTPILLNMHKCEKMHIHKLKAVLSKWVLHKKSNKDTIPKIGVFYAHMHQRHEVHIHCMEGFKVPFVYVGSVPNNRFSLFKMNSTIATVTGYKARDSLMHNGDLLEHLGEVPLWGPCIKNEHILLTDTATKRRWKFLHQLRNGN